MRKSRVLMVAAGLFLALAVVWVRVMWLQVPMHAHYMAKAAERQESRVKLIPRRGDLLDRNGRVLARDLQSFELAIYRPQVRSVRALAAKMAPVLRTDARALAKRIEALHGYAWLEHELPPEMGQELQRMHLEGVVVTPRATRDYRLGPAAFEILGRTDRDNVGVDGVEYQYESDLGGRSGWVTLIRAGEKRWIRLPGSETHPARDGASLTLTIDADLQAIVEHHLARTVDSLKATRGFAIFLDPNTGEILAAACVPHLEAGRARNWTFTDQYEPGSTFKVVVAGAVLEEGLAKPTEYFAAVPPGGGKAELLPGVYIGDAHGRPGYTFFGAIQNSSNIVCGKLGLRLGAQRLYRYAASLGFGTLTGIEFPGETSGRLRPLSRWQPRSTPTVAIGQEVAVTPLQLALAYAAIANGGVLMEPMLVKEVRAADGTLLRRNTPQPSHRVFSEATTAELREMLCAVVDSGTATLARLKGMRIAGKTGTAQKVDPALRRYGSKFMASFAGFAPAENPRIVGVVVVDEPPSYMHYGGQVAAPVFREVVLDLMRQPNGVLGTTTQAVAARPPAVPAVTAPDLRLLPRREAELRLADFGLHAHFEGAGSRVLSQSPAAGQPVERGGSVVAWLSPPQDSLGRSMPNLSGLPMREALRRLSQRQVVSHVVGNGFVVRQEPAPGTPLPVSGGCRLWCEVPESGPNRGGVSAAAASSHRP
ncbi:MAG: penicillin-binding transpeptidase domain-containing protein [Candidatus Eisenbacteria bacterium]